MKHSTKNPHKFLRKKMVDYYTTAELAYLPLNPEVRESVTHDLECAGYTMLYRNGELMTIAVNADKYRIDYDERKLVDVKTGEGMTAEEAAEAQYRRHTLESISVN